MHEREWRVCVSVPVPVPVPVCHCVCVCTSLCVCHYVCLCEGLSTTGPAPCVGCPPNTTLEYDHCKQPAGAPSLANVSLLWVCPASVPVCDIPISQLVFCVMSFVSACSCGIFLRFCALVHSRFHFPAKTFEVVSLCQLYLCVCACTSVIAALFYRLQTFAICNTVSLEV